MKRHDIRLRSAILAGVAVLSLLYLTSSLQHSAYRPSSGVIYPQYGVSLFWEMDAVAVKVDDREERVPREQLGTSAIYQEAIARIPRDERPAVSEVRWGRVFRSWITLTALTWWLLFRVWQPQRPYIEGAAV
jgi:hypothetical protein